MQNTEPLRGGLNTNPLLFHRLVEADVAEERLGSYCVVYHGRVRHNSKRRGLGSLLLRTIHSAQSWWTCNTGVQSLQTCLLPLTPGEPCFGVGKERKRRRVYARSHITRCFVGKEMK